MASKGKRGFFGRFRRAALDADARVDHGLFTLRKRIAEGYGRLAILSESLILRGWRKHAVNAASGGLTLAAAGAVATLTLAIPAFRETNDNNWLKKQDLAVVFLDRFGTEIGKRGIKHDDSAKLEDMPEHFVKAVLSTEDRRFYEHFGIDIVGTIRALTVNARSSAVVQGGSSITQQLAKNLFLTNERSIERKIKEAFLAVWLEHRLSKRDILKLYLDRAYMGGGTFGAVAAADYYFGKPLKDVTLAEAAMLAGLFKAPTRFAPHANLPAARARAADVLSNMVEAGFMTQGEVLAARRNPATPVDRRRDTTADYYLDWAFSEAKRLMDQGKFGDERVVTIKTSLDLNLQRRAESAVETIIRQHGDDYEVESGAAVLMDVDGAMRAMVGGRDYGQSQFNRAADAQRAPGSSFKPFVYAAALEAGLYNRNSTIVDRGVCVGNWCPQNYGRSFAGAMPLTTAVAKSVNTTPVIMTLQLGRPQHPTHDGRAARAGRDKIVGLLRRMGVQSELKDTPSMSIGSVEMTVVEMAQGYAAFARHGLKVEPYAAVEARNSRGDVIYRRDRDGPPQRQIISRQVAEDMNFLLSKVPEEGTGRRAALPGIRTAGKTGTTDSYRNAWYVGYSGNFVSAVWLGNDDYSPTSNMTGGSLPAMIWHEIMSYAHQGVEIRPIPGLPPMDKPAAPAPAVAQNRPAGFEIVTPAPASRLTRRGADALLALDEQLKTFSPRRVGEASGPVQVVRSGSGATMQR